MRRGKTGRPDADTTPVLWRVRRVTFTRGMTAPFLGRQEPRLRRSEEMLWRERDGSARNVPEADTGFSIVGAAIGSRWGSPPGGAAAWSHSEGTRWW
jgi:hypothetical protein